MSKGTIIAVVALIGMTSFFGGYFLYNMLNSQDAMLMIGEENKQWVEAATSSSVDSGGAADFMLTTIGWQNWQIGAAYLEAVCTLPHTLGDKSLFIDAMRVYLAYLQDGGDRLDHIVFYVDGSNTHQDLTDKTTAGQYHEWTWTAENCSNAYAAIAEVGVVTDGTLDIVIGSIQFRCYYA